jgi:hypothetical protein
MDSPKSSELLIQTFAEALLGAPKIERHKKLGHPAVFIGENKHHLPFSPRRAQMA